MTLRNRLVTEQDGRTHVSGTLIPHDEIAETLDLETDLHRLGGWDVREYGQMRRFQKGTTIRWVWVRSRPPMEDTLT